MIVVDTSVIVDFLRQKEKQSSLLYSLAISRQSLLVSIITHTELFAGKSVWENPAAKRELEQVFSQLQLVPLTANLSLKAGQIRAQSNTDLIDAIIAATAIDSSSSLATLNVRHFSAISHLQIYSV